MTRSDTTENIKLVAGNEQEAELDIPRVEDTAEPAAAAPVAAAPTASFSAAAAGPKYDERFIGHHMLKGFVKWMILLFLACTIQLVAASLFHTFTTTDIQRSAYDRYNPLTRSGLEGQRIWQAFGSLIVLSGLLGCVVGVQNLSNRRRYFKFNDAGVYVSVHADFPLGDFEFIPWEELKTVAFDRDPAQKNAHIVFGNGRDAFEIKWSQLLRCADQTDFVNAVKTKAGDASLNCNFPGDAKQVDSASYTQLWFKYYSAGSERKRTTQLEVGDVLNDGRYTIAGLIGGGGQGTAYLAVDNRTLAGQTSEVVLKEYILPVHRGKQVLEQTIEKLEQEAAILRSIDHANVVRMLDSFTEDHRGYLVMEYIEGKSLKEIVQNEGAQPESVVLDVARQVTGILEYLHGMSPQVVHRDLTPDNLIMTPDGRVKLVDFNVAHQLESAATATVVGKHAYIPPEQFRGKPTAQSDIYALGCTMHYLLTAQDPEPLTASKPALLNETVSPQLNALVAKATAVDAARRIASAGELKEQLEALKTSS